MVTGMFLHFDACLLQPPTSVLCHECLTSNRVFSCSQCRMSCAKPRLWFLVMTGLHVIRRPWQCCRFECASAPQCNGALEGAKDTVCIRPASAVAQDGGVPHARPASEPVGQAEQSSDDPRQEWWHYAGGSPFPETLCPSSCP